MERVLVVALGFLAAAGLLAASLNGLVDAFRLSRKDDEIEEARYSSLRGYLQRDQSESPGPQVPGRSAG